ncbi:MAG: hypothetical protein QOF62_1775 [Pyrinomonadaceae bacterium]|jgi:hypothetical protein|nr:hypothetical protein [Pyrinomonadaceae bacterium]
MDFSMRTRQSVLQPYKSKSALVPKNKSALSFTFRLRLDHNRIGMTTYL